MALFEADLERKILCFSSCADARKRDKFLEVLRFFVCNYRHHADSIKHSHKLVAACRATISRNEKHFQRESCGHDGSTLLPTPTTRSQEIEFNNYRVLVCGEPAACDDDSQFPASVFLAVQFSDVLMLRRTRVGDLG